MNIYYVISAVFFGLFVGYHSDPEWRKALDTCGEIIILIVGAPFILGGSRFGEYLATALLSYGALKLDGK